MADERHDYELASKSAPAKPGNPSSRSMTFFAGRPCSRTAREAERRRPLGKEPSRSADRPIEPKHRRIAAAHAADGADPSDNDVLCTGGGCQTVNSVRRPRHIGDDRLPATQSSQPGYADRRTNNRLTCLPPHAAMGADFMHRTRRDPSAVRRCRSRLVAAMSARYSDRAAPLDVGPGSCNA